MWHAWEDKGTNHGEQTHSQDRLRSASSRWIDFGIYAWGSLMSLLQSLKALSAITTSIALKCLRSRFSQAYLPRNKLSRLKSTEELFCYHSTTGNSVIPCFWIIEGSIYTQKANVHPRWRVSSFTSSWNGRAPSKAPVVGDETRGNLPHHP